MASTKNPDARDDQPEEAAKSVRRAWRDFDATLRSCLPDEFWQHRRAARREMLLAARSLIDAAIERIEEEEPQRKRAQKIEVE